MTYDEIAEKMPEEYERRAADKLVRCFIVLVLSVPHSDACVAFAEHSYS
jgi:hypothetical protein